MTTYTLPGYSEWAVLGGLRGSHVHGTYIPPEDEHGTDDTDLFLVAAYDRDYYLGLGAFHHRREDHETSGDHLDWCVYDVRKFVSLLAKGNPNVHFWLWLDDSDYFTNSDAGRWLIGNRRWFLSRRLFTAFAGYAYGQLKRMTHFKHEGYMGEKRKGLVGKYGYDVKNAAHLIRLLHCSIHLGRTGEVLVRLDGALRDEVVAIKTGRWSLEEVQQRAEALKLESREAEAGSTLPSDPDEAHIDHILRHTLELAWAERVRP